MLNAEQSLCQIKLTLLKQRHSLIGANGKAPSVNKPDSYFSSGKAASLRKISCESE